MVPLRIETAVFIFIAKMSRVPCARLNHRLQRLRRLSFQRDRDRELRPSFLSLARSRKTLRNSGMFNARETIPTKMPRTVSVPKKLTTAWSGTSGSIIPRASIKMVHAAIQSTLTIVHSMKAFETALIGVPSQRSKAPQSFYLNRSGRVR